MEQRLETQIKQAILNSKEYNALLDKLAKKTNKECDQANSEETVAVRIEFNLKEALMWHNFDFAPIREQNVKEKVRDKTVSKRIDSRFRNVICEYKKRIIIDSLDENTKQLIDYIVNVAEQEHQPVYQYVGVLTDGRKIRFCTFSKTETSLSPLLSFDKESFRELIKIYLSLDRKDLSSTHLLKDFSIEEKRDSATKLLARVLYRRLEKPTDKTFMLHSEWERLFQLASHNDNNLKKIKERNRVMSECFDMTLKDFNSAKGLFSLQTAYLIVIKLVAYHVVSEIFFGKTNLKFSDLLKLDSQALRTRLEYIENGEIFSELGITNLLEGDFFSWFVYEGTWDTELYDAVRGCIQILEVYDTNQSIFSKTNVHDLFNDLYQSIIPKEVRHSLGEYYTPNWLAEHVVANIEKPENWRGLDPCAGSGTFVLKLIEEITKNPSPHHHRKLLEEVIGRVKAIDINPLAVLTCRINYFIAISHLIHSELDELNIEVPVYLGDSAFVPLITEIENVKVINYSIDTEKGKIDFSLPLSIVAQREALADATPIIESAIIHQDRALALQTITKLLKTNDKKPAVLKKIDAFVDNLLYLEQNNWDRIWVRIIIGFLKIATLGRFEVIVGNPPWIDWKALPDGYRETLKSICVERHLFSGDKFTGGINLNICALIANVVANNWLKEEGTLAFLMPKSIAFQQSYAGFRNLIQTDGITLKYEKFYDWSSAGHPFHPVTEKFMTYYLKKTRQAQKAIVPTTRYFLKKGQSIKEAKQEPLAVIQERLQAKQLYGFMNEGQFNNFTFEEDENLIPYLKILAGSTSYKGRVGLGLFPKELLLFNVKKKLSKNRVLVENYQGNITERKAAKLQKVLETQFLYPVIEGPNIERFGISDTEFVAPFPYTDQDLKKPVEPAVLQKLSPLLYSYYLNNKILMKKTTYNQRVQGGQGAFYSITRVGEYTFAKYKVIYRHHTKWVAAVVSSTSTDWGGDKMYLLLDHTNSIAQDKDGRYIGEAEAHYLCAILNSPIVGRYILNSSDNRSYKVDVPINIKKYDAQTWIHQALAKISQLAHRKAITEKDIDALLDYLMQRYITEAVGGKQPDAANLHIEKKLHDFPKDWCSLLLKELSK